MPTESLSLQPTTLDLIPVGSSALILRIQSDCDRAGRLSALGFIPGRTVKVTRLAPLGDPISIEIDRQEISLRRTEAKLIEVQP